jgi:hypothetical protein
VRKDFEESVPDRLKGTHPVPGETEKSLVTTVSISERT